MALAAALLAVACAQPQAGPAPVAYTIRFPDPAAQTVEIEAVFPTGGRAALDLMMAVWSPGFYRVQN